MDIRKEKNWIILCKQEAAAAATQKNAIEESNDVIEVKKWKSLRSW
jgi:hypothetical protein